MKVETPKTRTIVIPALLRDFSSSKFYLAIGLVLGLLAYSRFIGWTSKTVEISRIPVQLESNQERFSIGRLNLILNAVFSHPEASLFLRTKFNSPMEGRLFQDFLKIPYASPYNFEEWPYDSGEFRLRLRLSPGTIPQDAVSYLNVAIEMVKSERNEEFKAGIASIDAEMTKIRNIVSSVKPEDSPNKAAWDSLVTSMFADRFKSVYARKLEMSFDYLRVVGDFGNIKMSHENEYFGNQSLTLLLVFGAIGISSGLAVYYIVALSVRLYSEKIRFLVKKRQ